MEITAVSTPYCAETAMMTSTRSLWSPRVSISLCAVGCECWFRTSSSFHSRHHHICSNRKPERCRVPASALWLGEVRSEWPGVGFVFRPHWRQEVLQAWEQTKAPRSISYSQAFRGDGWRIGPSLRFCFLSYFLFMLRRWTRHTVPVPSITVSLTNHRSLWARGCGRGPRALWSDKKKRRN